jgi:tripartite-type tricarboxylate transporter receptor subunit TctC
MAPLPAHAQNIMNRTTKIVIGLAGGSLDTVARVIAEGVHESTDVTAVVESRPGANERIAAKVVKNAAPDGNTLLLTPAVVIVLAPLVFKHLNYDPAKDLAPLAHIANF